MAFFSRQPKVNKGFHVISQAIRLVSVTQGQNSVALLLAILLPWEVFLSRNLFFLLCCRHLERPLPSGEVCNTRKKNRGQTVKKRGLRDLLNVFPTAMLRQKLNY